MGVDAEHRGRAASRRPGRLHAPDDRHQGRPAPVRRPLCRRSEARRMTCFRRPMRPPGWRSGDMIRPAVRCLAALHRPEQMPRLEPPASRASRRARASWAWMRPRPWRSAIRRAGARGPDWTTSAGPSGCNRALSDLPDAQKAPLLLAVLEGRSHAEIASILRLSPKAVEIARSPARAKPGGMLASVQAPTEPCDLPSRGDAKPSSGVRPGVTPGCDQERRRHETLMPRLDRRRLAARRRWAARAC